MHPFATVSELRDALAAKRIGAVELTRACLDRIDSHAALNSFIAVCAESALAAARAADAAIARDGHRDLLGVPIAHKDIFCTDGIATTCASRMMENYVPPFDAAVVAGLRAAGTILIGKTNMDEFAMGASNETSYFGPVANPWDASRVPGGSSGGSAAAVAAGLVPAATGTDTGGSIRQPAALCGISGLKPTYGRVSRYGMVAFASSLDHPGPMARSAADLRLLLRCMEGHDPRDSTSAAAPPTRRSELDQPLRIGIAREYREHLDAAMDAPLARAAQVFERLGHRLRDIALPHTRYAVPTYYVLSSAEASANLARYDGVRYGYRAAGAANIDDLYRRSRTEGFGAEVKRRILTGVYALCADRRDACYRKAQRVRRLIRQDFLDAFGSVDAILVPATPATAPLRGQRAAAKDPTRNYGRDAFTAPASLAGLPALSLPCGAADGLPVGMQLIAPHFAEDRLLALGEAFQRETPWHLRAPPGVARAAECENGRQRDGA